MKSSMDVMVSELQMKIVKGFWVLWNHETDFTIHIGVWFIKVTCRLLFGDTKSKKVLFTESVCQPKVLKQAVWSKLGKSRSRSLNIFWSTLKDANISLIVIPQKFISCLQYLRFCNWSKKSAWWSVTILSSKFLLGWIWICTVKF